MPRAKEASEPFRPTRISSALFRARAIALQVKRSASDRRGDAIRWPQRQPTSRFPYLLAESRTALWAESDAAEQLLQQGKVQNLRCALRQLAGIVIAESGLFSFWRQIGRATPRRGYVRGRQLREGCLYPEIGGGLCQLSNVLYELALQCGFDIVERHAHGAVIPGSAAERGRDATVAWNYIDLRFRPRQAVCIEARLTATELVVAIYGRAPLAPQQLQPAGAIELRSTINAAQHSCPTCGVEQCYRHKEFARTRPAAARSETDGPSAWLMDEFSGKLTYVRCLLQLQLPASRIGRGCLRTRWTRLHLLGSRISG